MDLDALLLLARQLVIEVSERIAQARAAVASENRTLAQSTKSTPTDMVTEMDVWAERHITDALLAARPDDAIIGEEGTRRSGTSGVQWYIDPIDGTTNYLYGHPGYSVSIGAAIDGQLTLGAVADPTLNEVFWARRGAGAYRNGARIQRSPLTDLSRALLGTGFGYDAARRRAQAAVLERIIPDVRDIRRMGGAAVDLCSVACGRLDAYYEYGIAPWDIAAGSVIATEAGAVVTDLDGMATLGPMVVAAPPALHATLCSLLRDAGAERMP
jgi:myo-inositol-1(or 4)-monophosphatase